MPTVVFWNVQRSKGYNSATSASGVTVGEDLAGLADRVSPDAIVLCELVDGYAQVNRLYPPSGFVFCSPSTRYADYFDGNTLRYALIVRASRSYSAFLLPTAENFSNRRHIRPALGVLGSGSTSFVALHAIAGNRSAKVKIAQAEHAARVLQHRFRRLARWHGPDLVVGDFNINLADCSSASVNGLLDPQGPLRGYEVRATKDGTQSRGGNPVGEDGDVEDTRSFASKLDWALLSPRVRGRARVHLVKPKRISPNSTRNAFLNQKRSDHLPIVVEW